MESHFSNSTSLSIYVHLGKDRTIKLLSVECESESGDSDVYLSSLKEEVCSVGYGAFGTSGSLGYENKKITVNGKLSRYIYPYPLYDCLSLKVDIT